MRVAPVAAFRGSAEVVRQERIHEHVAAAAADVHEGAQEPLAVEARGLRDAQGCAVAGLDPELDSLHLELVERVATEEAQAPSSDPPATLLRGDPVARGAAAALGVEVVQTHGAEQP